jgi:hypothetical protein
MRNLPVEFLMLQDNDWRSTGAKTQLLIQMARADWVCGMGDDDILHPDFFTHVLAAIKKGPPVRRNKRQVVGFNIEVIQDEGRPHLLCKVSPSLTMEPEVWGTGKDQFTQYRPWAMTCPIRKSLFNGVYWPDTSYGEDHELITQIIPKLDPEHCVHLDRTLYYAFPRHNNPDRKHGSPRYGN